MMQTYAVTGVASGIGAEIAKALKAEGHQVVGFDVQHTDQNVDEFIPLDLSDPTSIDAATESFQGRLNGLCNNAGIPPRPGNEAAVLQINFLGQRQFTQAMLKHLEPGAAVVNMASKAGGFWRDNVEQNKRLAALRGPGEVADFLATEGIDATRAYNLSKEAMILWTMSLTETLIALDLRANSVSPAAVATGILDDFTAAFGDKVAANLARTGRAAKPDEVAALACFLLSPKSSWMKGMDITIDGGIGALMQSDMLGLDQMKL